jgi:hypothetical protein
VSLAKATRQLVGEDGQKLAEFCEHEHGVEEVGS